MRTSPPLVRRAVASGKSAVSSGVRSDVELRKPDRSPLRSACGDGRRAHSEVARSRWSCPESASVQVGQHVEVTTAIIKVKDRTQEVYLVFELGSIAREFPATAESDRASSHKRKCTPRTGVPLTLGEARSGIEWKQIALLSVPSWKPWVSIVDIRTPLRNMCSSG